MISCKKLFIKRRQKQGLSIGGCPMIGVGAMNFGGQLTDGQLELTLLKHPLAFIVDKSKVVGTQRNGNGFRLTRLQFHFVKAT